VQALPLVQKVQIQDYPTFQVNIQLVENSMLIKDRL